jgi:DNA-binding transcriptional LysR family regulator
LRPTVRRVGFGGVNVHHLELFYYVARHGGISAAVRHIPYGIQQPAVSGQMRALEENTGAVLFVRSPFRLTPAGEVLFAHVRPFFENLGNVAAQLRPAPEPELRLGASELVLRDHVPLVMQRVRARHPRLRLSLRAGHQAQLEAWLREAEIELAIGPVDAKAPARLRRLALARVPLVLLAPRGFKVGSAEELLASRRIAAPLVGLPASSSLSRNFQAGLRKRGVTWPQTAEVASVELIARYVANGEGFGVNLAIPSVARHRGVRVLPLSGFTPLTMGLLWRGEPSPQVRLLIDELRRYSRATWPDWAEGGEPA